MRGRRSSAWVWLATTLGVIASEPALAQTQVIILEPTRQISAEIVNGEEVRKILGDVRLEIDGRIVQCDSAVQYLQRPLVTAYRVRIEDEQESIEAERLYYDTETEIATFVGQVNIRSQDYTAFGDTVDMDLDTRDGVLRGRVQWFDSTRYAEADHGFVNYRDKRYRLQGRVYGESSDQSELFRADTLVTDSTGSAWLTGQAWLRIITEAEPDADSTRAEPGGGLQPATGEAAPYPDSLTSDLPLAAASGTQTAPEPDSLAASKPDSLAAPESDSLDPAEPDTTILTAGIIQLLKRLEDSAVDSAADSTADSTADSAVDSTADPTSESERISAGGSPQPVIWSTRLSSRSDSLHYDTSSGLYQLIGSPLAWMESLQLSADWINATLRDEQVRDVAAGERPVAVIEDSLTLRLNQMTGDTLRAVFDAQGDLQLVEFNANSELVYHQRDEDEQPDGAVRITSDGIARVVFEGGEVRQLAGERNIDGFYVPESPQAQELRIQGFRWDPDLRPIPSAPPERRFSVLYLQFMERRAIPGRLENRDEKPRRDSTSTAPPSGIQSIEPRIPSPDSDF